jgi:hypothetical protein
MNRIFVLLLLVCCAPGVASAQALPKLNVEPGCKAAATNGDGAAATVQTCLQDERDARNELAKRWSTFPARDRRDCIAEVSGFEPSYVELLECVVMAGEARQEEQAGAGAAPAAAPKPTKKAKQ